MVVGETYTIQIGDSMEEVTLDSVASTIGETFGGMPGRNMKGQIGP